MRAVVLSRFGPPSELVLSEIPDPVAGAGQVVVRVEAASITFVETQVRAGRPPHPSMAPRLPFVPGNGVGGIVTAVGPGADTALGGQRVVTTTGGAGGYAELVAVGAGQLIPVPDEVSMNDAVALLADGRTALALTRAAAIRPGETVLVEAAAGGVGSLLVQLSRNASASVIAAASGPVKLARAAALGADWTIDYSAHDWAGQVRARAGAVDVVFDGVGGAIGTAAFALLGPGGRFCAYGMASGEFSAVSDADAAGRDVRVLRGVAVSPEQMRELTAAALQAAAGGTVRPVIGQTFPLAEAGAAHAAIESRATIGKTLLLTGLS
jgi:NADPH2:quinone reductase